MYLSITQTHFKAVSSCILGIFELLVLDNKINRKKPVMIKQQMLKKHNLDKIIGANIKINKKFGMGQFSNQQVKPFLI